MPWLLDQLQTFAECFTSAYPLFPSDMDEARAVLDNLITNHVFLVAEQDGELMGFIAGVLWPHSYNKDILVLNESFWWVSAEHRGTRAGALLLTEFMEWGKREANWVVMTLEDNSPVREESLLKRGFRLKERNYLYEVPA